MGGGHVSKASCRAYVYGFMLPPSAGNCSELLFYIAMAVECCIGCMLFLVVQLGLVIADSFLGIVTHLLWALISHIS